MMGVVTYRCQPRAALRTQFPVDLRPVPVVRQRVNVTQEGREMQHCRIYDLLSTRSGSDLGYRFDVSDRRVGLREPFFMAGLSLMDKGNYTSVNR